LPYLQALENLLPPDSTNPQNNIGQTHYNSTNQHLFFKNKNQGTLTNTNLLQSQDQQKPFNRRGLSITLLDDNRRLTVEGQFEQQSLAISWAKIRTMSNGMR